MISWFHQQRLDAVHAAVMKSGAESVLDLGCGEGHLLARLAEEPRIQRIVGIDLSHQALERLRGRVRVMPREKRARIELVHGSLAEAGLAFRNFDAAILVETVEHVAPEHLSSIERSVFGTMCPGLVVITTPNAEFNALLGVPRHRFRHHDHRFEWDRAMFGRWVRGVAARNGYDVARHDIAGRHAVLGGASQMAVFTRVRPADARPLATDA